MLMHTKLLASTLLLLSLLGCTRETAVLTLEPAVVEDCALPVAVHVRWDASALGLHYAQLETNNIGKLPKLWISGASKGEDTTGVWAWDGYTVTLKSVNDVVLARRTLTTLPCTSAAPDTVDDQTMND